VFPEGAIQPLVSNLNFTAGETLANLVTVELGSQGGVTIYNHSGLANIVVDAEGYYTTTPQAFGLYNPVNPLRILGSLASGITLSAGMTTAVSVAGVDGVPADASAVVANVTAAGSTGPGYLSVFPAPDSGLSTPPSASNVNFGAGQVIGNRVIIPVGIAGQIEVFNYAGTVRVDVDLDGYYTGSSGELGSAFVPLSPTRFTDTRVAINGSTISPDSSESFNFLSDHIPTTATALLSNVTVVAGGSPGYLSVYPVNLSTPPEVSDIDFASAAIDQNLTVAQLSGAATELFNSGAVPLNVVIDAFGYFAPPPPAVMIAANPISITADDISTLTLTITVTTGSGVAFDDPVTISLSPNTLGACGMSSFAGSTNALGQVTSTYTASNTPGLCTITATEANGGTMGSTVITQTPTG